MSWLAESKNASERGFALPTILIASIVMLMVLLSSVQTAVSVNTAIDNQYYNKLAQVAAESGAAVVQSCLKQSQAGEAIWSTKAPATLTPAMDCEGTTVIGASPYVLDTALVKSTFIARVVASSSTGLPTQVSIEGSVSRHRQSNGNAWKGYTTSLAIQLDRNSVTINNLSSGVEATCASVGGKAYCWGNQANGRLGNLATAGIALSPQPVVEEQNLLQGRKVTQISVGYGSVCAIAALPESTTGGRAYCWGDNSQGQLGNGTITGSAKPVAVTVGSSGLPNTETVTSIAAGRGYACAVATARLYCWGSNSSGQLGIGTTTDLTANRNPRPTSTLTTLVKEVYAGSGTKTTCALRTVSVDRLYCWGNNSKGQTGQAASAAVSTPYLVSSGGLGSGTTFKVLNASVGGPNNGSGITSPDSDEDGYVCAVKANTTTSIEGIGYCWGSNKRGAIGAGPTVADDSNVTAPTEILNSTFVSDGVNYANYAKNTASTPLGTIQKIVTGWGTSCAIRTTIGTGSTITSGANPSPDPYHSGTSTNKAIVCWGANELSNLALNDANASKANIMNEWTSGPVYAPPGNFDGTTSIFGLRVPRHIPPFMPNSALHMSGVTDLYGGGHRMCVVTGGRLYCWGNNAAGQVGSSQTTESRVAWPILADLVENLKGSYLY